MRSLADRFVRAAAPPAAHRFIRFLGRTVGREYRNLEALELARGEGGGRYVLAFWHSRFLMMPYCYPDDRLVVLLSRHRDARMLARVLGRFGLDVAYGSSTRGGVAGLREVLRRVRDGYDVGLAPDGPRGPRRQVKPGVLAIAKLAGIPIVPVAFSARRAWRLRSWDRTLVPKPFTRGLYVYGNPVTIPRDEGTETLEAHRARLQGELDRLTDLADRETGLGPEEPATGQA